MRLSLCRAGLRDFSSVAQSCLALCNPVNGGAQAAGVGSQDLAWASPHSLSSGCSDWLRGAHTTQDRQSRLRGVSRPCAGTFGAMGFSAPTAPRLGAATTGRSSNRAEAEGGAEKAEPEMENGDASS